MKIAIVDSGLGLVHLLKEVIKRELKQDIDLVFSSFFPLGNASSGTLINEGQRLYKYLKEKRYDIVMICCNTLSFYIPDDENFVKIFNINKEYLEGNNGVLPIGTLSTVENIGYGYGDKYLATDIEEDNLEAITDDILAWPKAEEYLLCCTHYSLIKKYAESLHPDSIVTDLIDRFINVMLYLPQEEQLKIDYGGKEQAIKKHLMF